jgi:hypothetical protein
VLRGLLLIGRGPLILGVRASEKKCMSELERDVLPHTGPIHRRHPSMQRVDEQTQKSPEPVKAKG